MANHLHRQIREAVETLLTGLTTTSTRVYANRLQPMADANLPGLRVFLDEEEVDALTMHSPYMQDRRVAMIVECCAKAITTLDDTLDASSKEVEAALSGGITLSGKVLPCVYAGMQFDDALADKPVGVKRLRFFITYTAMSNAPDVLT
ncbi:hypothetical protein COW64_12365 [bacterium (Candidatus Blackallbacteria) CG18_big_fil_WC_8_21_14_2_50_49_26]|nr:MAG: hypothetical protein COW64_12365 [bacterium (Candidatus Blackallbacteria) CG18_big_fil_WC_8_21_14_2_50_49_26]